MARRLAAVGALLQDRLAAAADQDEAGHAYLDPFQQTAAEVAAAMNLSPAAASWIVTDAEALDMRLPKVAALLAQGLVDWRTVRTIIRRSELVSDLALVARLDESLAARIGCWRGWSQRRVSNAVDAAVRALDADAVRERRRRDIAERGIQISALDNGMAAVSGTLSAEVAAVFDGQLSHLARGVCAGDPRTLAQRRADAVGALALGRALACLCGQPGCPATTTAEQGKPAPPKWVINMVASEDTVYGRSEQPGYLEGYGVIDAAQVRELAEQAWLQMIDPVTHAAAALRYQPSAALARAVRCRDLTCRFPGCARRATHCDVDHTVPFNHADPARGGPTVFINLKCLCRLHHRLKTFGGWRDVQLPDGTVVWTSPSGHTYRTSPAGADLFPSLGDPACAAPTPSRRRRAQRRSARIAAARRHNRHQRPINHAARRLKQARKDEIEGRKFRNHLRKMRILFKGTPHPNPRFAWINEPFEPEELPPDWKPDLPEPEPVPDEPPF